MKGPLHLLPAERLFISMDTDLPLVPLEYYHSSEVAGHEGPESPSLKPTFYWQGMKLYVKEFVKKGEILKSVGETSMTCSNQQAYSNPCPLQNKV